MSGPHPIADGLPPRWASAWGEDAHGAFVAFAVGAVEQRMRWIPPGTFVMGSPETELGRWDDEVQHLVTLTEGYWLGETPVTQAIWEAVMEDNPSAYKHTEHPVETVSWDDCQHFLARLWEKVPDLDARLPTEAEWERACRGGTTGATWVGELSGIETAPELDAIAWYYGNTGNETKPVGGKLPNPYGLHDMLGNVHEWCMDLCGPYMTGHARDPVGASSGPDRVIRGGSWGSRAQRVRAAYRSAYAPAYRGDYLGFRLAGDQGAALTQVAPAER